jgi:sec-independent protein translocase protein TatA
MNFGNIGFTEILILLLVFVLFFGARRIPEIGASIGKGIREFKNSLREPADDAEGRSVPPPAPGAGGGAPVTGRDREGEPKRLAE